MKQADFEDLVERIRKETTELLVVKGREYAGDADRLANFKRGAVLTKHYDALATYIRDNQAGDTMPVLSEPITGRVADLINYCVLAWALIEEKQATAQQVVKDFAFPEVAVEALPAPAPRPRRVRVMASTGQTALLDGQTCDEFLLAVNRLPAGTDLVFEGSRIASWKYEDETDWRKC
jgi:hypothetical protein